MRVPIDLERSATGSAAEVETRIAAYQARGLRLWPVIDLPSDQAGVARWRTLLQQWLARHRGHVAVLEVRVAEPAAPFATFAIQAAATDLRASAVGARLAIGGPITAPDKLSGLSGLIDASVAPYVDLIAAPSRAAADAAIASLKDVAPAVKAVLIDQRLPADPDAARTALIDLHVASLASDVVAIAADGEPRALEAAVGALRALAPLLSGEVDAIDAGASSLTLSAQGQDVSAQVPHRLLFENRTFGMYLFYRSERERHAARRHAQRADRRDARLSWTSAAEARRRPAAIAGTVSRSTCRRRGRAVRCWSISTERPAKSSPSAARSPPSACCRSRRSSRVIACSRHPRTSGCSTIPRAC